MRTFMNCKGDDDIDCETVETVDWENRFLCHARLERVLMVWDPISGLHQGQRPQRLHSKAVYMAATRPAR